MTPDWHKRAVGHLRSLRPGSSPFLPSVPGGPGTLYGTCYGLLGLFYLGEDPAIDETTRTAVAECQDPHTGMFIGPELRDYEAPAGAMHHRRFLIAHQTCAVLPFCQQFSLRLHWPLREAHAFCDLGHLTSWTQSVDWRNAWFEGNAVLFVGQLLVYLRDCERRREAETALAAWFAWLDRIVDRNTGLWGTDGSCSTMEAVYGGYHQLLVYYHENHHLPNIHGLVDTVLSLQHFDGGFNPHGNGGACEDVDSVDILVNCYKRLDYRRADIRLALRRCLDHILSTQNRDGGFPYNRESAQTHMGIPGTAAPPNVSCTFPTWFRIHTLALIAEVLPDHPQLSHVPFRFSRALSMGWHRSPSEWRAVRPRQLDDILARARYEAGRATRLPKAAYRHCRRAAGTMLRGLGLR